MIIGLILFFLLVYFAIELAIGFWLLITSYKQDIRWLKILGLVFGWLIIGLAALFMLIATVSSISYAMNPQKGCPMWNMMRQYHQAPPSGRGINRTPCPYCP